MESRTMKSLRSALAYSLITTACIATPQAFTAEKAVVYQAFQSIQYLPLYVAIDEGLFTKNGLDVQKITAGSGAQGVAAVIGGHGDFSLQDPMTAVLANLKGAALTNVAMIVSGVPVWMVAPPNSPIKTLADLKDQTVSTAIPPSTSTYLLQNLLKEKGMSSVKLNTVAIGIRPASYCGAVGYKPTFGLIPTTGVHQLAASLDHLGFITSSIYWATVCHAIVVQGDDFDPASFNAQGQRPRRIGVYRSSQWAQVDPEVQQNFEAVLARVPASALVLPAPPL